MKESIKNRIEAVRRGEVPEGYDETAAGIIPADWSCTPLSAISEVISETAGDRNFETLSISAGIGFVNQAEKFGKELSGKQYAKYTVLRRGDFAYNKGNSKRYPQGCTYMLKEQEDAAVPNVFECFRIICGQPEYYEQLFIHGFMNKQLTRKINHGVRDDGLLNLTEEDFYSTDIPVPPLTEQQKIAEILATCDRMIELKQQLVDEYKKTKKVFLRRLFPTQGANVPELRFPGFKGEWRKCQLGELSDFITKGATPTTYGYHWETTGIPFFRNDSIQDNRFVYGAYSFISETVHKALSRSEIKGDDILIAITGDIGKVGIVPKDVIRGNINQHMARVRIIKDALPFFIYQYLSTATMQNNYQVIKTGISMPQLSLEQIRNTEILLPSLAEQQCIASCLKNLDEAIELRLQEVEKVQRKKKALMQLLLTGLVRVNA